MNVSFPVKFSDFDPGLPWSHPDGTVDPVFSWSSVLRAAITAGYPGLTSLPSRRFARWRSAGFRLALRHSGGRLIQPPEAHLFDPAERGAVNSLLGVVVAKLLAERFLNAPLFLFLDVHFQLTYPPNGSRIRPDFAAMTPSQDWFSVESKGRSRFRRATLDNGKSQAAALGFVNGSRVKTGVVSVTSFRAGQMEARFADPDPEEGEVEAKIEIGQALRSYYGQLERFRRFAERLDQQLMPSVDRQIALWRSPQLDVDFGILPELEVALKESPESALSVLHDISQGQRVDPNSYLGPDGIVVVPGRSWEVDS
jgi:hypothetical protein